MDDDPVWGGDMDHAGPVDLAELGASEALIQQLRGWNEQFNRIALSGFHFPTLDAGKEWLKHGLELAKRLQQKLPDIEIYYGGGSDERSLREQLGMPPAPPRPPRPPRPSVDAIAPEPPAYFTRADLPPEK